MSEIRLPAKSVRKAVGMELLCGLVGVFGVGSIYGERTATGVKGMIAYWVTSVLTACLLPGLTGSRKSFLLALPVLWVVFAIPMSVLAVRAVDEWNSRWAA